MRAIEIREVKKIVPINAGQKKALAPAKIATLVKSYNSLSEKISVAHHKIEMGMGTKEAQKILIAANNANLAKRKKVKEQLLEQARTVSVLIQSQCSNYVAELKKSTRTPWHGFSSKYPIVFEGKSLDARRPKDSRKEATEVFNQALAKLGIKANRTNSIFVIGNSAAADEYTTGAGKVYAIIPKNTASFCYSTNPAYNDLIINDFTLKRVSDVDKPHTDEIKPELKKYMEMYLQMKELRYEPGFDENKFRAVRFLASELESFVKHAVLQNTWQYKESLISLKFAEKYFPDSLLVKNPARYCATATFNFDKFKKEFQMTDKNFGRGLELAIEIAVSGEYIAVEKDFWILMQEFSVI